MSHARKISQDVLDFSYLPWLPFESCSVRDGQDDGICLVCR